MLDISNSHIEVTDTKSKILAVANELFARQGFDGVSVRDLAHNADVNVAAVNYHFKNKLNLFHEIFDYNYEWLDSKISAIADINDITAPDMAVKIYELFQSNGSALINSFKMILSDHLCPNVEDLKMKSRAQPFGPPGGEALLKVISKDVGKEVPYEKREWAMRMTFALIIHMATMLNTTYLQARCAEEEWMKDPQKKFTDIRELSLALLDRIQK